MVSTPDQLGHDALARPGQGSARSGGGLGGVPRNFLVVDEPTLKAVAATTGGSYHSAADAQELTQVLHDLPRDVVLQTEHTEVTAYVAALAALLVLAALGLSLRWNPLS